MHNIFSRCRDEGQHHYFLEPPGPGKKPGKDVARAVALLEGVEAAVEEFLGRHVLGCKHACIPVVLGSIPGENPALVQEHVVDICARKGCEREIDWHVYVGIAGKIHSFFKDVLGLCVPPEDEGA